LLNIYHAADETIPNEEKSLSLFIPGSTGYANSCVHLYPLTSGTGGNILKKGDFLYQY